MILVLLILTMILLSIGVIFTGQKIISPSFAFIVPMTFSAIYLSFNIDRWSVNLNVSTYLVIAGGCISFLIGVMLVNFSSAVLEKKNKGNKRVTAKRNDIKKIEIEIDNIMLVLFSLFQVVAFLVTFRAILSVARNYGYSGSISNLIYGYRYIGTYTTESRSLGSLADWLYRFGTMSGYIWGYLISIELINKRKCNFLLIFNFLMSIIMDLSKGGRESAVQLVVATLVIYLFLYTYNSKREIPISKILKFGLVGLVILLSFQSLGVILGRTVQADPLQFIAVYISGGIRNLDVYLSSIHTPSDIFGKMTFIKLINYLGNQFNIDSWIYELDLPYQSANGNNSGNIYTTFYAYIYDFGYIGAIVLPFVMGFISQLLYRITVNVNITHSPIKLSLVIYSYVYYMLACSFFSNKFYEQIANINILRYIFVWYILIFILTRIKLKFKG